MKTKPVFGGAGSHNGEEETVLFECRKRMALSVRIGGSSV
jgi:hypothetical protein